MTPLQWLIGIRFPQWLKHRWLLYSGSLELIFLSDSNTDDLFTVAHWNSFSLVTQPMTPLQWLIGTRFPQWLKHQWLLYSGSLELIFLGDSNTNDSFTVAHWNSFSSMTQTPMTPLQWLIGTHFPQWLKHRWLIYSGSLELIFLSDSNTDDSFTVAHWNSFSSVTQTPMTPLQWLIGTHFPQWLKHWWLIYSGSLEHIFLSDSLMTHLQWLIGTHFP